MTQRLKAAKVLLDTGMLAPTRPSRAIRSMGVMRRWGPTPAAAYGSVAARYPDRAALVDERGVLTFEQLDRRTNALARGLGRAGVAEGDGVAIMARNHRGFIEATAAVSKLGAGALYLNTAFAGPQIADVIAREDPVAVIYDEEFTGLVGDGARGRIRLLSWSDSDGEGGDGGEGDRVARLDELIAGNDDGPLQPPGEAGRTVILTSGTTGTPKGAARRQPDSIEPIAALFSKIPFRARETTMIAAPLFHSWGFAHFTIALPLASTMVLRRRFDAEDTLRAVAHHGATALVLVPVMLQRILELGEETIARYDTSSLRIIALSGSALPGELATRAMDVFGDVLYNLYGSTEVAWATIATPEDLRAAPGTAGRPPLGTVVKLLDENGPRGRPGPDRAHLRGQRDGLRGLHRRRQQGGDRGADEHRRRGPPRRGRAPVRRRPRRRNDRQRRRERVPARGRGPARRPRGRRGGGGDRRPRRRVRPAAAWPSWSCVRGASRASPRCRPTCGRTWPASRSRAR